MARAAPHQAASPWAARQRTAMWAAAGAAALVLVAVVAHVRGGHRAELLQSAAGRVRRMQALSELSGQSVLENEERQAFMNGFRAGEQTAQRDVVEDERSRIEGAKLASLRKALLSQGKAIKQAEEERVALLAQQASREAALKRVDEERVVPSEEEERAMLVSEQAAEEQRAMAIDRKRLQTYEEERAAKLAEEKRAMLVSEKAAEYAQAWQEAAAKQVQAEAMARAEAAFDRRAAAAARLQQKHTEEVGVQAKPGTKRAAELLDFCAQEFGEDPSLQQFCYDKLISKPYGDGAVLDADVQERDGAVLRERVIDAPTIKQALAKARKIGLDNPPKFAELANGELYKVMPLQKALKQHVAQQAQMQQAVSVHPTGHGGVEVDAMSLKKSVEEAHKMGFKGSPEAVVYHPADGKPVVYKLETPQQAQQLSQLERSKPKEIEVHTHIPKITLTLKI